MPQKQIIKLKLHWIIKTKPESTIDTSHMTINLIIIISSIIVFSGIYFSKKINYFSYQCWHLLYEDECTYN